MATAGSVALGQYAWLKANLAAHPSACVMAVWHEPRWSIGPHGDDADVAPLFHLLHDAGAEIVVNGHDHQYERLAPMRPNGMADPAHGIREFVVGTGGAPHYAFNPTIDANSQVRNATTFGVLELTLGSGQFAWHFLPVGRRADLHRPGLRVLPLGRTPLGSVAMQPRGPTAGERIEHFRAWLEQYATALERGDLGAFDRLFTVEATYRTTPFAPILRGRRRIREHLQAQLGERPALAVTARALGVGSTYAVAHWVSGWTAETGDGVEDGILLAAFDLFGRCTSLRAWHVLGQSALPESPPDT